MWTYGVDFGTTRSAVVIRDPSGTLIDVRFEDAFAIPSSVCLAQSGELLVGFEAERSRTIWWEGYRRVIKTDVGRQDAVRLRDEPIAMVDLVAQILKHLHVQAVRTRPATPDRVVVTVPTGWDWGQREVMRTAVGRAGFDPDRVRFEWEPAAALAYVFEGLRPYEDLDEDVHTDPDEDLREDKTVLVYGLGGGMFDPAIAVGRAGAFQVLACSAGLSTVGGRNFDTEIENIMRDAHPDRVARLDPGTSMGMTPDRLTFDRRCEEIKCWLSDHDVFEGAIPELKLASERITRAQFEERIAGKLDETFEACERLLRDAGKGWTDIDLVALVGGSSRIPAVAAMLRRRTGRRVLATPEPQLAVVRGAAILAASESSTTLAPRRSGARWPPPPVAGASDRSDSQPSTDEPSTDEPLTADHLIAIPSTSDNLAAEPPASAAGATATDTASTADSASTATQRAAGAASDRDTVRFRLRPRSHRSRRIAGLVLLAMAALVALVAPATRTGPAPWVGVGVGVLGGLVLLWRSRDTQRAPLSIGVGGIRLDDRTYPWQRVARIDFVTVGPEVRDRQLVIAFVGSSVTVRLALADLWASERELREGVPAIRIGLATIAASPTLHSGRSTVTAPQ